MVSFLSIATTLTQVLRVLHTSLSSITLALPACSKRRKSWFKAAPLWKIVRNQAGIESAEPDWPFSPGTWPGQPSLMPVSARYQLRLTTIIPFALDPNELAFVWNVSISDKSHLPQCGSRFQSPSPNANSLFALPRHRHRQETGGKLW
jgi:hypothetical protein